MQIHELKITGFKSFAGTVCLTNLSSFTSITGLNGLGKSNILDAIIFCLHLDTPKQLRIKKIQDVINQTCEEARVTVVFRKIIQETNNKRKNSFFADLTVIERSINRDGKQKTTINNAACTTQTLKKLLSEHGITKSTQNVILQGNITKLLDMHKNFKLFIEETAGIKSFEEEKRNAIEILKAKESKLFAAKESLKRRIEPFFSKMREERYSYIEQKRCEENKEKNLIRKNEIEKMLKTGYVNKIKTQIKRDVNEYINLQEDVKILKSKLVDDNDGYEIFSVREKIDEKEKELCVTENNIKDKLEEIQTNEVGNKRAKLNDTEEINKKLMILRDKENFLVDEMRREEKNLVGLTNTTDFVKRIAEFNDLKIYKMQNEEKINTMNKSIKEIQKEIEQHQCHIEDMYKIDNNEETYTRIIEHHQALNVDDYEINNLTIELQNKKSKLNYPLIDGVYGTVIENIQVIDQKYKDAIDVILGGRRNYIIVENENIGEELIKNSGNKRMNVIPLNKIKSTYNSAVSKEISKREWNKNSKSDMNNENANTYSSPNCAINYLRYDSFLKPAIDYIFGSFYVCESKEDAKKVCFEYNTTCVTVDGNVYDPRGVVTGGSKKRFVHENISKTEIEELEKKLKNLNVKQNEYKKHFRYVTHIKEYLKVSKTLKETKNKNSMLTNKIQMIEQYQASNKNSSTNIKNEINTIKNEISALENILRNDKLIKQKNDEIKRNNMKINEEIKMLKERNAIIEKELKDLRMTQKEIEVKMHEKQTMLHEKNMIEEKIKQCVMSIAKIKSRIKKNVSELCDEEDDKENIEEDETYDIYDLPKKAMMVCNATDPLEILSNENEEMLKNELFCIKRDIEKLNQTVKVKMNPKNSELLEKNEESIKQLEERILKLENNKNKIKKSLSELNKESENEMKKALKHINKETGAFLNTFINGSDLKISDEYDISVKIGTWKNSLGELSGGQRSIVALCLIFAMLSYKPAPFYLFDEIDSALDLSFTQSVGLNIQKKFGEAQFIVISLKEGLFENAGSIWQVYAKDGKSDVRRIK
ncbi:Structural maintenance of chromosomes protein 2 [Binucleata daphniae]